jgi:hypothetical protein
MGPQLNLNDIGRNCLLGNRKKIAKFLMRTFTCRSTFLYGTDELLVPLVLIKIIFYLFAEGKYTFYSITV